MRDADNTCSYGKRYRLREVVSKLPFEIEFSFEHNLRYAGRIHQAELIVFAPQVHMRLYVSEFGVGGHRRLAHGFGVARSRGNLEIKSRGAERKKIARPW